MLPHLTDQDLKDLDVLLGHRRKMLAAIAEFAGVAPVPPALTEPKPQDTAERRQLTVLFSDLVGSTALAARVDPVDFREVISACQKCVAVTVRRFGFVAKYMGDGVLVYFGYPQAHEDDAERAVRAGLELVAAVNTLKSRIRSVRSRGFGDEMDSSNPAGNDVRSRGAVLEGLCGPLYAAELHAAIDREVLFGPVQPALRQWVLGELVMDVDKVIGVPEKIAG
jgi:Adenylate and Guanylate cyclase catalytic domain